MNPGDTFKATARWGPNYYDRYQVEAEFQIHSIESTGTHVCYFTPTPIRRLDTGEVVKVQPNVYRFRIDRDGLLRELKSLREGFKGSDGFRQVAI